MEYFVVAAGGAVGAPLRYLTDRFVSSRVDALFPWGTFTVNVVGSAILGVLGGAMLVGAGSSTLGLLLGVGLCGALTTYSTFSYETARLVEARARWLALANVVGSVCAGLAAATLGFLIGSALFG
ncbi:MAG: fluoride efflux transporter CrcB [Nakamurella sp.]